MVNPLLPQNSTLSVLQAGTDRNSSGPKPGLPDSVESLIALVGAIDPVQGEALRKEQSQLEEALQNLEKAIKDPKEQRQAAAEEKIARIKAQLAALRMLANTNPEAAAKQAQRLAQELSAAARDYANAGGGNIGATAGGAGIPISIATGEQAPAKDPGTARNLDLGTDSRGAVASVGTGADNEDGTAATPDAGQANVRAAVQAQIAETNKVIAEQERDANFARDVRGALNSLKSTIEAAKRKLLLEEADTKNPRIDEAENTLRGMEHALSQISPGGGLAKGVVNIVV